MLQYVPIALLLAACIQTPTCRPKAARPLSCQVRVVTEASLINTGCLQWQSISSSLVLSHESQPQGIGQTGQPTDSTEGRPAAVVKEIIGSILQNLDAGNVQSARAAVVSLSDMLNVAQGHVARERGGVQYRPEFMLDSVLFTDCLRPLRDDSDVMRDALEKQLICV